ncbi:MAG: hydrogenase maturation protease [Chloroflexi bacterium]|nr:hydrogenase maturation protease [Chloroflexota bacterium]
MTQKNVLIAGFGNAFRRDDGVARGVVNALRARLDRPPLGPLDDGFDDLGHRVDTVLLHQLVPELAETLAEYDFVIFVDAHVDTVLALIHEEPIASTFKTPFVSHQMHPSTILSLTHQIYDRAPEARLLSLLGHDFDFGEGLSDETAALVPQAVARLMEIIARETGGDLDA